MSRLSEKIKELRIEKDWTSKQLSQESGVSYTLVINIESKDYIPSDLIIGRISKALGADFKELVSLKEDK